MRISIIIPTLNEEKSIGKLISELHARAAGEIHEIIIADGGSSDNTRQLAADAGAEVISCLKKKRSSQMNAGAKKATGELFYFLHADSIPPYKFDRMIKNALTGDTNAGCFRLEFSNNHAALRFYGWCTRFEFTFLRYGDQSLFVTPGVFYQAGGFNDELTVMEDNEIVRRLKKITSFVVLKKAVLTSARKYENNGFFRLQFIFIVIYIFYHFGAHQETMIHLYNSLIKKEM